MIGLKLEQSLRDGNLLGDIIRQVYLFLDKGKEDPNFELVNPVGLYAPILAKDFLGEWGFKSGRRLGYMVKPDNLPWDFNLNSIVSRGKRVFVETRKLDMERIKKLDELKNWGVEIRGRSFWYNGNSVIPTYTRNVSPINVDVRTASKLPFMNDSSNLEFAIDLMNLIDVNGCYEEYPEDVNVSPSLRKAMDLIQVQTTEQREELRQALDVVQTPKLVMALQQNAYIQARRIFGAKILQMNQTELNRLMEELQ